MNMLYFIFNLLLFILGGGLMAVGFLQVQYLFIAGGMFFIVATLFFDTILLSNKVKKMNLALERLYAKQK